jgi:hypothetical protein
MSNENKLGKQKKSPTLQQTTVVVPIGRPAAPYGYDPETDLPLQPPQEDRALHSALMKRKQVETARCKKHPDYPSADCHKCKEESDQERARANASASRPIVKPIDPPEPAEADPRQKDIEHAKKFLGVPETSRPLIRPIPLTSTATPWSGTSPNDIRKYNAELRSRAEKEQRKKRERKLARLLKPAEPPEFRYRDDLSLRKVLGLSRAQIASWLKLPEILYLNPPIERAQGA